MRKEAPWYGDMARQEPPVFEMADRGELYNLAERICRVWQVGLVFNSDTVRSAALDESSSLCNCKRYLSLMSVLDRQGIPRSLLQTEVDGNVDTTTALGTLQAFSIISHQAGAEEYETHRLIQLATQKWLQIQGTKDEWQERALRKLADIFRNSEFESWITCDLLLPHAQKVLANDYMNEKYIIQRAYLSRQLGILDNTQGQYEAASTRLSVALDLERNTLGVEHPCTLSSMANLASMYWNQGRWDEAEKLEVQVMETSLRVLKEDHPSTLTSTSNDGDEGCCCWYRWQLPGLMCL